MSLTFRFEGFSDALQIPFTCTTYSALVGAARAVPTANAESPAILRHAAVFIAQDLNPVAPSNLRCDLARDFPQGSDRTDLAVLFEQDGLTLTGPGSSVSFALSDGPVLGPGSYWVSLQTSDTTEWDWGYMSVQHGDPARWRNPGNGFATGCMAYQPLASCGISGTDFVFRVDGQLSQAPSPPVTKKKKCKKHKHRSASAAKKHCKKKKH